MKLLTLIQLTLLEAWRQRLAFVPIGLLVLLFAALLLPVDAALEVPDLAQNLASGAGSFLAFVGVILAINAGGGAIANEIERGTVLLLASKPLPRPVLVLGKGLGVWWFLALCFAAWGLAAGLVFWLKVGAAGSFSLCVAVALSVLCPLLFATIALCASTLMPVQGAIGLSLFTWLASGIAPNLVSLKETARFAWVGYGAEAFTYMVPGGALTSMGSTLAFGGAFTQAMGLALLAVLGWFVLAVLCFQWRELA